MNIQDLKYQQKSKSISSAEPNYLLQFEMRYPVLRSIQHWSHSALMSVELIAFGHVQWNLSKFLYAKNHFLASKGKETPSIKHRWRWTVYPCGYRQYILHFSSGYLLSPGDFWHKIWNFLRTKTPLGFTIHTERHQFY